MNEPFALLLGQLRQTEQVSFLEAIFRDIQRKHFSDDLSGSAGRPITSSETVKGAAALCSTIVSGRPNLESLIVEWLSKSQGGSITTLGLRRALLATYCNRGGQSPSIYMEIELTTGLDILSSILHRSLEQFGDKFSVKHLPNVVQNGWSTLGLWYPRGHLLIFTSKCASYPSFGRSTFSIRQNQGTRSGPIKRLSERSFQSTGCILEQSSFPWHDRWNWDFRTH